MKNKIIINILIVMLAITFLVGCSQPSEPAGSGAEPPTYWDAEYEPEEEAPVGEIVLCEEGESDYRILIASDCDEIENYAAKELQLFIKESTGCTLQIVTDEGLTYNKADKFISIGETAAKKAKSDLKVDFDTYGRDGFVIKYFDNSYLICGGGSYGSLYGVYEFLHRAIGWEAYAADEIYYQTDSTVELEKYDISDIPAFANRTGGYFEGREDAYACARLRTYSANFGGIFDNDNWTLQGWVHNLYRVMPSEKYNNVNNPADYHPEWYQAGQLCLSNTEMREEFARRFIGIIKENPSVVQFMISNMDNTSYCQCDNCMQYNRLYDEYEGAFKEDATCTERDNTGRSVLQMEFVNYIARQVKAAFADDPQRQKEIKIVYNAYYYTEKAPIKWDSTKQEYAPINDDCIPEDNVAVLIASINAGFYYDLLDEKHNAKAKAVLDGWSALGAELYGYVYGNNFNVTAEWFDDFSSVQKNMQFYAEIGGGNWFFTENASGSKQSVAFQKLRQYVYSKLQWNPYLDMNELIDDFMLNYYKAGSSKMKEYFEYLRLFYDTKLHEKEVNGEVVGPMGSIGFDYGSWYHEYNSLLQMNDMLSDAIEVVQSAGYDAFTTTTLVNRIKAESMTVRYYLLNYCQKDIDNATYVALVEAFRADAKQLEIYSDVDRMCDNWLTFIKG